MSADAAAASSVPVSVRGRGAPVQSVTKRMGEGAAPAVVALAEYVQALACRAFLSERPWMSLVRRFDAEDRALLNSKAYSGKDDENRRLSSYLSSQFGAKARRGPSRAAILVILKHCLDDEDEAGRAEQRERVEQLFQAVHGPEASLAAAAVPKPRRGGPDRQPQEPRGENETPGAQLARLQEDLDAATARCAGLQAALDAATARNLQLITEQARLSARLRQLELNATAPAAARPVQTHTEYGSYNLVRPYTQTRRRPAREPGPDTGAEPDGPPPARELPRDAGEPDDAEDAGELPTVPLLGSAHRTANTPRSFLPLPELPLDELPWPWFPEPEPPPPPGFIPARVPRPRTIARAVVPFPVKVPAPRHHRAPAAVWGTPAARVAGTATFEMPAIPLPLPAVDEQDGRDRAARRAQAQTARRLARPRATWCAEVWTDVAVDRLPACGRGCAQLPMLAVSSALSLLIAILPASLLG